MFEIEGTKGLNFYTTNSYSPLASKNSSEHKSLVAMRIKPNLTVLCPNFSIFASHFPPNNNDQNSSKRFHLNGMLKFVCGVCVSV